MRRTVRFDRSDATVDHVAGTLPPKLPVTRRDHGRLVYIASGIAAVATVAASLLAAPGIAGAFGGGLAVIMIAIAAVDARYFIIPDILVLFALFWGLLYAFVDQDGAATALILPILRALILSLTFLALRNGYKWLRGREGIGLGDVKLAAVAGVWLDWLPIALAIEIAALAGIAVVAVVAIRGKRVSRRTRLPFGAFFAPAIWLGWLLSVYILSAMF